ncbi:MAG: Glyoxalase/bleomycin resistance protein/dioxygenase [Acidimicrobiales bacterium]|nr:Glyoxalase/bleomycin resistance protein/dioxygenase [Acidimicrobiales bacterium]
MTSSLGQYCINVTDLDASVAFYEALGLSCTSRTEIPQACEAIVENPGGGSKLQLAQQVGPADPFDLGTGFWKLYVNTHDAADTYRRALEAGATDESRPERMERWPVTVGFVRDRDGYLVELVQRHPWPDDAPGGPWLGQYCLNVTDIEATIAFYELLGLTCTSRTEIAHAHEAILERPGVGSKLQLAQQHDQDGPIRLGSMWKLYVDTDDCQGLYDAAIAAGHGSVMAPMRLDRWPVTIAFVADPDGYQVELVERRVG